MADPSSLLGPIDGLAPYIGPVLLVLVVVNMVTRLLAHRKHKREARDGAEAIERSYLHDGTNLLLVLASFYFMSLHQHGGLVLSTLVLGMVLADFFEFEARKVEARTDEPIDKPKGALAASMLVLVYTFYQAAFFVVEPVWSAIV